MRLANGNASLRCDYCKTVVVIDPDDQAIKFLDEVEEFACPVCAVSLWTAVLGGVPIHACRRCRGLLVAMGALEPLIDHMRASNDKAAVAAPSDPADLLRRAQCPHCHAKMDIHFYYGGGHAVISSCEACNLIWLDHGVLTRIARASQQSGSGVLNTGELESGNNF